MLVVVFVASGTVSERGLGFRGSRLCCLDECSETDSPALDYNVTDRRSDLSRRSFEEINPYRTCQPSELTDVLKQRSDTSVQTEVRKMSTS